MYTGLMGRNQEVAWDSLGRSRRRCIVLYCLVYQTHMSQSEIQIIIRNNHELLVQEYHRNLYRLLPTWVVAPLG